MEEERVSLMEFCGLTTDEYYSIPGQVRDKLLQGWWKNSVWMFCSGWVLNKTMDVKNYL